MKAIDITEKTIHKAHCDWIRQQANKVKALLQYDDKTIVLNKQIALSSIDTAMNSLEELKLYINQLSI